MYPRPYSIYLRGTIDLGLQLGKQKVLGLRLGVPGLRGLGALGFGFRVLVFRAA